MYSLGCSYGRSYTVLDVGMPTPVAPQITSSPVWNALPRVGQTLDVSPGTLNDYFPGLTSNTFEVFDGDPAGSGVPIYGPDSLSNIRAYVADSAQDGAILYLRWTVANNEGSATANVAAPGTVLPTLSAPIATLNVGLSGRVVMAWLTGTFGVPAAVPTLDILTAAGSDVASGVTGAGDQGNPWRYAVPPSGSSTDIVIGASLDNGVAPAWSETNSTISVPSDQTAPTATVALAQPTYADGETVDAADIVPSISTAGNPALQLADLTAILMVDGTPVSLPHTAVEGEVLMPLVTASHPTGVIDAIGNGVTVLPGFSLTESLTDAELEINGATGTVTITVTNPAVYATYDAVNGPGIFIFDDTDLATGPVNIVPLQVIDDGTPAEGETLTITPGLWVYEPENGGIGTPTYQWQADTAGNGTFADISGATSASYTLTSDESGDDVRVRESLTDNGGTRTVDSAIVSVDPSVPVGPTFTRVASGNDPTAATNGQQGPLFSSIDLSSIPEGDEVMVAILWSDLAAGTVSAPTLDGVTLSVIPGATTNDGRSDSNPRFELYRTQRPAGSGIVDLQIGMVSGVSIRGVTYFIYHVQNRTTDVDVDIASGPTAAVSVNTVSNGTVFAATIVKNESNNSDPIAFTGVTKDGADETSASRNLSGDGKSEGLSAGTLDVAAPRPSGGGKNILVALSVG